MTGKSCCGGSMRLKKKEPAGEPLPPNPAVPRGVSILYLGAGKRQIAGARTGSIYHVSDHHRLLKVFPEDAEEILSQPHFIRKP